MPMICTGLPDELEKQPEKQPIDQEITPNDKADGEEQGSAAKPSTLTAAGQKGIALLAALDDPLVAALKAGAIKLLRAEFLRAEGSEAILPKLLHRQALERMEKEQGIRIFLTLEEVTAALRTFNRAVAALTYGWTSPDHPDVTGEYLANVRRFLRNPLGKHVTALFWDFSSLPQKPRLKAEDELFSQALEVMGGIYASPMGTTVIRHRSVPARPAELDGEVVILVEKGGEVAVYAALRSALGAFENPRCEEGRWRVRFPTHAAAEEAVEAATAANALPSAIAIFLFYNGRPYAARGCAVWRAAATTIALKRQPQRHVPSAGRWTTFESAVSTEALARLAYFPRLGQLLEERLPPKVIEIDGEGPRVAEAEDRADEGMGPRNERVIAAIQEAEFTGKGDKPVVVGLYRNYAVQMGNALANSGEGQKGEYEGEFNAAGEREGCGVKRYANGDFYEGEFKAGKMEGRGVFRFANGDVYDGEWKAGKQEGRGVERFANGNVYEGEWKAGEREGRGVERYASGNVYDGEYKAGSREGRGVFRCANGGVFEGDFKADKREGRGDFRWANGDVKSCFYKQDAKIGEGIMWAKDGRQAWRLCAGKKVEAISLEEARQTAEQLSLLIPSPLPALSPRRHMIAQESASLHIV